MASSQRGYTAGRFLVELDGSAAGFVESVEGGDVFSDVVMEKVGADGIAHKHLAGVRYDDLTLVVGPNMSKSFFEWIASTLDRKFTRKDGTVSFQDYTGSEKERLVWQDGLLSELAVAARAADLPDRPCEAGDRRGGRRDRRGADVLRVDLVHVSGGGRRCAGSARRGTRLGAGCRARNGAQRHPRSASRSDRSARGRARGGASACNRR
ncbi:MAG: hypothetical protein ACJ744_15500 [Gaiellaceae bacterium]